MYQAFCNYVTAVRNGEDSFEVKDEKTYFEKVLALYLYFSKNYTYDYDSLEKMKTDPFMEFSAYSFLT